MIIYDNLLPLLFLLYIKMVTNIMVENNDI